MFNITNYVFWKVTRKVYIQSLGANVWDVVEETNKIPPTLLTKY